MTELRKGREVACPLCNSRRHMLEYDLLRICMECGFEWDLTQPYENQIGSVLRERELERLRIEAGEAQEALERRFWSKVRFHELHWEWIGAKGEFGHGRFKYKGASVPAYRMAWELVKGPIPDGMVLHHSCLHNARSDDLLTQEIINLRRDIDSSQRIINNALEVSEASVDFWRCAFLIEPDVEKTPPVIETCIDQARFPKRETLNNESRR